jgi:hypothetical protein
MLLPKGDIIQEGLLTTYLDINSFITNLKATQEEFTGYIRIDFWQYQGILFWDAGRIINAIEEIITKDNKLSVKTKKIAQTSILAKCKEADGKVSVSLLPGEEVVVLASVVERQSTQIKDLSTEFVVLDKLITSFADDEWGLIHIIMGDQKSEGAIYIGEKEPKIVLYKPEVGDVISGDSALKKISEQAGISGGKVNVYKLDLASADMDALGQQTKGPSIKQESIDAITTELTRIIGPMASMIIEESASTLGEDINSFPKNRANELIQALVKEIGDKTKGDAFAKMANSLANK